MMDWEDFLDTHNPRYEVFVCDLAQGRHAKDTAARFGFSSSWAHDLKESLAEDLREHFGEDAIADSMQVAEIQGGQSQARKKTVEDLLACIPEEGWVEKQNLINTIAPSRGIAINKVRPLLNLMLAEQPPRVFEHPVSLTTGAPQVFISRRAPEATVTQEILVE